MVFSLDHLISKGATSHQAALYPARMLCLINSFAREPLAHQLNAQHEHSDDGILTATVEFSHQRTIINRFTFSAKFSGKGKKGKGGTMESHCLPLSQSEHTNQVFR